MNDELISNRATVVVLYRPYVLRGSVNNAPNSQSAWQIRALERARAAAGNTNKILEECINKDMVRFFKPMTLVLHLMAPTYRHLTVGRITSLMPAMQIHLLDCKSPNALSRQLGNLKLQLCMIILSELRETYWGADFAYRMFERAQAKLAEVPETHAQAHQQSTFQHCAPNASVAPLTPESTEFSQAQSTDQPYSSYPSLDAILGTSFSLGDTQYPFWMNDLGLR